MDRLRRPIAGDHLQKLLSRRRFPIGHGSFSSSDSVVAFIGQNRIGTMIWPLFSRHAYGVRRHDAMR
jgi:hypothetical protein